MKYRKLLGFMLVVTMLMAVNIYIRYRPAMHADYHYVNRANITSHNIISGDAKTTPTIYIEPSLVDNGDSPQDLLVIFDDKESVRKLESVVSLLDGFKIQVEYKIIPAILVNCNLDELISTLKKININAYIYKNRIIEKPRYWTNAVGLDDSRALPTTYSTAKLMGADTFWENGYNGTGIRVCVIDTGIDSKHPELSGKVVAAKSFISKKYGYSTDYPYTEDEEGHGTACAGIIAGKGIDPRGQGMAPRALLMNARIFYPEEGGATLAAIIAAIEWATFGPDGQPDTGDEADVISMSFGGGEIYKSPIWPVIKQATNYGVVAVASAGNEGGNQLSSMSVGDPGNEPWVISVGASNPYYTGLDVIVDEYTSFGPTIDLAVKPDVIAPSGTIVLDYQSDGYTSDAWHGTSFSCPHVAGSIALILDYLKNHSITKSEYPWVAKSVLMYSASPLYKVGDEPLKYEDMIIGAGAVNLTAAYNELSAQAISSNNYPQWLVVLPKKIPVGVSNSSDIRHIPYFPYFDRVFINQTICFNVSIVASKPVTLEIDMEGNFTSAITLNSPTTIDVDEFTTYWELNFTVNPDSTEGFYSGRFVFNDTENNVSVIVPINFTVMTPRIRILFDLRHTDWSIDFRYGQYRFLARAFEVLNNASIDTAFHNSGPFTFEKLKKYDLIFIPDTAAMEPIYFPNGTYAGEFFDNFLKSEIEAINQYISSGGTIIVFALNAEYHNITNINELIKITESAFKSQELSQGLNPVDAYTVGAHMLTRNVSYLPHYGLTLDVSMLADNFLEYQRFTRKYKLAAVYQGFTGGAIIFLGSNFMFDNWAFYGEYGTPSYCSYNFIDNIVDFVAYGKDIFTANITTSEINRTYPFRVVAKNLTNLINVTVIYKDSSVTKTLAMEYNASAKEWQIDITPNVTGAAYIMLKAYTNESDFTYYISKAAKIEINPGSPPVIEWLSPDHIVTYGDDVQINIRVTDVDKLDVGSVSIDANISGEVEISAVSDNEICIAYIIDYETIYEVLSIGNPFDISVSVVVSDIYAETSEAQKIFTIEVGDTEPPVIMSVNNTELEMIFNNPIVLVINISDNYEINKENVCIEVNLSDYSVALTQVSNKVVDAKITIPWSSIQEGLENSNVIIGITVSATDKCLNEKTEEYTYKVHVILDVNPPTIKSVGIQNNSQIEIKEKDLVLEFEVEDDYGIKNITVGLNWTIEQYDVSIDNVSTTKATVHVTIPYSTIKEYLKEKREAALKITITAKDVYGNEITHNYIFTIKMAAKTPIALIIAIAIVIVAIIAVVIVKTKLRK